MSALSADSDISKSYLVAILASALLSVSPSVAGYPDALRLLGIEDSTVNQPVRYSVSTSTTEYPRTPAPAPAPAPASLCKPGCVTVIDYLSNSTHLEFSRTYNAALSAQDKLPARWRHRYEIRLTRHGDDRIVFDHHGFRHLFRSGVDGTFSPADSTSGSLHVQGKLSIWIDRHAIQHEFHGSFLTRLRFPDNQELTLHYRAGQLQTVTDEKSGTIEFIPGSDYLPEVQLPDGQLVRYDLDPCNLLPQLPTDPLPDDSTSSDSEEDGPLAEASPERCDTQENPVAGFDSIETRLGASTLDARPASCQSYFVEFYGTVRGAQIESGLEEHLPYSAMIPTNRSFPIIDFINGNELIVVRSRDVASPSYNNPDSPNALFDRLMRDGQQIQTRALDRLASEGVLSGTENGRTTLITHSELQSVTLHLLIRQGMAGTMHWQQIEKARIALAARYGIQLQVIIIP